MSHNSSLDASLLIEQINNRDDQLTRVLELTTERIEDFKSALLQLESRWKGKSNDLIRCQLLSLKEYIDKENIEVCSTLSRIIASMQLH